MVRVGAVRDELKHSIEAHIRRVYPFIRGPAFWTRRPIEARTRYFESFNLVSPPLIEAIPQYQPGQKSKPEDLKDLGKGEQQKTRLEGLGEILKIKQVDFDLYDHQVKSILGALKGKDVVVATGTGSGKTESFLYPMLNMLHDEAIRCKEDKTTSERSIKCLILYPMNALVADQLSRLRDLLGDPKVSTYLHRSGYGRFPQFGMYTGRTPYHGWFAKEVDVSNEEDEPALEWQKHPRVSSEVSSFLGNLANLEERVEAWKQLTEKQKLPAIGGRVEMVEDGDPNDLTLLKFEHLSIAAQRTVIEEHEGTLGLEAVHKAMYSLDPNKDRFTRFRKRDFGTGDHTRSKSQKRTPSWMPHVNALGDGLDRELIARYQMHLGGVRQWFNQNLEPADVEVGGETLSRTSAVMNHLGVGIPDVMVTNYSMLEYMLMRPLEHIFWHRTRNWLHGCHTFDWDNEQKEAEPEAWNLRRRVMLVVDEAHLYRGAMGTEFSLLLNRLLNVLDVPRERLHFIITSASLGADEATKQKYVKDLLSLSDERSAELVMPQSTIVPVPSNAELEKHLKRQGHDEKIRTKEERDRALERATDLIQAMGRPLEQETSDSLLDFLGVVRSKPEEWTQRKIEDHALKIIFGEERYTQALGDANWISNDHDLRHQHLAYHCVSDWPVALRLKQLLLQPSDLNGSDRVQDRSMISEFYYNNDDLSWFKRKHAENPDVPIQRFPRRYELLRQYLLGPESEEKDEPVLDLVLDLIATARPSSPDGRGGAKAGKSFLPLRMHTLVRGDNAATICPGCGCLHPEGEEHCTAKDCPGEGGYRTYELMIERNCGGAFIKLWCEVKKQDVQISKKKTELLDKHLGGYVWAHQRREQSIGGEDRWRGCLAKVLDQTHPHAVDQYWLHLRSGAMQKATNTTPPHEQMVRVHVPNKRGNNQQEMKRDLRKWEIEEGYVHDLVCPYCSRDFTRRGTNQYSNTQTRGDQFFLNAVTTLTTKLDPVESSAHLPHEGRKTLIFTDSRQGAARLATRFNTAASQDEGRALFIAMHKQDWYDKLPRAHQSLAAIYPYLCFFSGLKRMNTLSDVKDMGRTRMLTHAASLASHLLNTHPATIGLSDLHSEYLTGSGSLSEQKEAFVNGRIQQAAMKILRQAKSEVWKDKNSEQEAKKKRLQELEREFHEKILSPLSNKNHLELLNTTYRNGHLEEYLIKNDEWEDLSDEFTRDGNARSWSEKAVKDTRNIAKNDSLLMSCVLSDRVLRDRNMGHLDRTREILQACVYAMETGTLTHSDFAKSCKDWLRTILPVLDFKRPPPILGGQILSWFADGLFSILSLNLGGMICELPQIKRDNLVEQGANVEVLDRFLSLLPYITVDNGAILKEGDGSQESTARRILDGGESLFSRTAQYRSYASEFTYFKPFQITATSDIDCLRDYFSDHFLKWYEKQTGLDPNEDEYLEMSDLVDVLTDNEEAMKTLVRINSADGAHDKRRIDVNADSIFLIPEPSPEACVSCLAPKPVALIGTTCTTKGCSSKESVLIQDNPETSDYHEERLEVWRTAVRRLRSQGAVPRIYRAEEHTAQNSERLNQDDLFASTQLYELEFQDIPIQANKVTEGADIEHPPIDILSCSTTMEVGIDIGGLTSVALRNVPPHASNYQQRVGRAGRGSAEVSVALTWVDNTAFATSHFMQPERLVTHPDKAPRIYVKNPVIRRRHFNAICIQRFFKDEELHPYNPEMLTFSNSDGADQLLESLGTLEEFVHGAKASFGLQDFLDWADALISGAKTIEKGEVSLDDSSSNLRSIMQAMNMNESDAKDVIRYLEELKSKLTSLDASGEVVEDE